MNEKAKIFKLIEERIDTIGKLTEECVSMIYKAAYNEAIEDACKLIDENNWYAPIYKLKKE